MTENVRAAISGSREPDPSFTGSGPSGFDPGRSPAPPAYQAEVLRQQICDDVNRRFWRARLWLMRVFENRKERIQRDHEKLSAPDFLAKYEGHRFL